MHQRLRGRSLPQGQGMEPVIPPPRSHRKEQRYYDRALYKLRHLVENSFLDFKPVGLGGCQDPIPLPKTLRSFLAICQIRALVIWTPSYFERHPLGQLHPTNIGECKNSQTGEPDS